MTADRYQVQHADNDAIEFVLNNLWERGEEELELLGVNKGRAAELILDWRDRGEPTFSFRADGVPIFIAGLTRTDDPHAMRTWFQATEDFNLYSREITVKLREGIEKIAESWELEYVEIFSPCVHPKTGRWFRALGFTIDLDYHSKTQAGATLYRFVRRLREPHVLRQA